MEYIYGMTGIWNYSTFETTYKTSCAVQYLTSLIRRLEAKFQLNFAKYRRVSYHSLRGSAALL